MVLVKGDIGTLNSLLQAVQTPTTGVMESHFVTRRLRFGIAQPYFFAALIFAHRARCAAAIRFLPAADILRRAFGCALPFVGLAPVPPSRCSI